MRIKRGFLALIACSLVCTITILLCKFVHVKDQGDDLKMAGSEKGRSTLSSSSRKHSSAGLEATSVPIEGVQGEKDHADDVQKDGAYVMETPHTCDYILKQIPHTEYGKCSLMFEYIRNCVDSDDIGREPLPNFYLKSGNSSGITDDVYRQANIAFVHLPKAGGTSVEDVLLKTPGLINDGVARKIRVAHCNDLYRQGLAFRNNQKQTLFYSKRTFGLHSYAYPGRPFAYVTWLREPLDRLISTYHYAKRKRCFGVHEVCVHYLAKSANLTDYLQKTTGIHFQDMDNFYVRLLQFGDFPEVDWTFEDCCGGVELTDAKRIPKIEEEHYLVARRNLLNKMAFVGLMEDFKTSQDMLSHVFGIPARDETHINANPHKYSVTDFELDELRKRNFWDFKLYEDAKKIYEEQKNVYIQMKNTSEP